MLELGERVTHYIYGWGTVIYISKDKKTITMKLDMPYEEVIGQVIDKDDYFEDSRHLNIFSEVEVSSLSVKRINDSSIYKSLKNREAYCFSCKKFLSTELQKKCEECGWILCNCGACGCNYKMKQSSIIL